MARHQQRPYAAVPRPLLLLGVAALAAQLAVAGLRAPPRAVAAALPAPPSANALAVLALGDGPAFARLAMLWLQAQDYQPGLSLPYRALDYATVEAWLDRLLALDPRFAYPLLAAARLYGEVAEPGRQRRMIAFIARHYDADPVHRWPWLAHAVYLARHRLGDLPLALALARRLADAPPSVPAWARQMHLFVLEDMGELKALEVLLGGLLASGEIRDPNERRFLSWRLAELEARLETQSPPASAPKE